ncbi:MAG: hypothetical protein ACKO2L_03670 [Planctomycetaceae bacterium]
MARITRSRIHRPDETACVLTVCRPNIGRCYEQPDSADSGTHCHGKSSAEAILVRQSQFFCIELVCCIVSVVDIRQILRPRPDIAQSLTAAEVAERWLRLCPSIRTTSRDPDPPTKAEILNIARDKIRVRQIRRQLSDVSWWMRLLCQRLAQHLNSRNGLHGPFHEGRFRSQKLFDEGATNEILAEINLAGLPLDTTEQLTPKALRALAAEIAVQIHSRLVSHSSAGQPIAETPNCEQLLVSRTPASADSATINRQPALELVWIARFAKLVQHFAGPTRQNARCARRVRYAQLSVVASFLRTRSPPSVIAKQATT